MADIFGTEGADSLTGTTDRDFIDGYGGDDTLNGGGWNDLFYGGDGKPDGIILIEGDHSGFANFVL